MKKNKLINYIEILKKENLLLEENISDNIKEEIINNVTYDSRKVIENSLFLCKGSNFKIEYLENSLNSGAIAYVSEKQYKIKDKPYIIVNNIRRPAVSFAHERSDHDAQPVEFVFRGIDRKRDSDRGMIGRGEFFAGKKRNYDLIPLAGGNPAAVSDFEPPDNNDTSLMEHADITNLGNIEFAYCTEFFIINLKKKTTLADIEKLRETLMSIGDSVIVIGDLEFVKVHVHTNQPGRALSEALELGELDRLKIENMLEQNRELMKKYEAEKKEMGMMSVSAGDGITSIFKDLMVDAVIEGGQSMNPSADDIANAVQRINADNVFVFPNNKNIILAAEQAKSLVENKKIHVIPTKNIPQGFAAALAFNPDLPVDENKANMIHAIDMVTVGQVTYAVRETKLYGFDLKVGDIMGLDNKKILAKGDDVSAVTIELIEKLRSGEEIITLYYGQDVKEEDAIKLQDAIKVMYPDCDVEIHYGGQPIYYYYIALE